ncbi:YybH family protein [Pleurocapsa sp. FMAR1]|uniref:YybH family protein n=1 Tax=Pleurocapsa sp. FMAR1 TaxID=3040204 RepID=UPI0029C8EDCF|nr:nuclear transport factor 2 family protein [Pleurocapsa sp. FMAR1]
MTDSLDREKVLATNQAFYDASSSKDLGNMNRLSWQGSSSLCIHPGGKVLVGWDTIQASWKSIFNNTDSIEIDVEVVKVKVDWAIAYIVVRETVLQSSRGRKLKAQSIATNIF